ncbi:hypothetical protein KQX54_007985 [Cotesia glomerata]|uniref:Uncharacterized protein n=1 Tax=Cotesia glomerata TaxID=32391 RepID=A0AAV7J379_COTGL|nr:hypothetical protein KQX54_007985 [Cotesia glomerata]
MNPEGFRFKSRSFIVDIRDPVNPGLLDTKEKYQEVHEPEVVVTRVGGWKEGEDREKRLEEAEKARKLVLSGRTSIGREPNQWRAGLRFSQFQPPHKTRLASASQGVQKRWLVREHIHHWQTRLPTEPTTRTIVPYSPRSAAPTHRVSLEQEVFYCHPATPCAGTSSFSVLLSPIRIIENTQPCRKEKEDFFSLFTQVHG